MKLKGKQISDETFIKAWVQNKTVPEVAAALGIDKGSCQVKASRLRSVGVKLPKKRRYSRPVAVDELNKLISKLS